MAIRIKKLWLVYDSVTMTPLGPLSVGLNREQIEVYFKEHPHEEDPNYTDVDIINDLTNETEPLFGVLSLNAKCSHRIKDYVEEMLNEWLI